MGYSPITTGYILPARTNQGSNRAVFIGVYNSPVTNGLPAMTYTSATNSITAFGGATTSFFTVAQRQETAGANYKITTNNVGAIEVKQTVNITLEIPDNNTANWVETLLQGIWRVFVLDYSGNYLVYGLDNGMYCETADGGSNTKILDGNKITLSFMGSERHIPYTVPATVALGLIV